MYVQQFSICIFKIPHTFFGYFGVHKLQKKHSEILNSLYCKIFNRLLFKKKMQRADNFHFQTFDLCS